MFSSYIEKKISCYCLRVVQCNEKLVKIRKLFANFLKILHMQIFLPSVTNKYKNPLYLIPPPTSVQKFQIDQELRWKTWNVSCYSSHIGLISDLRKF